MARRRSIDDMVEQIGALRKAEIDDAARELLRSGLASRHGVVAAKAASVINARQLTGFEDAMATAFHRFMADGADKGCLARTAIAEALYETGATTRDIFETGARHVQMEPAYGGPVDAAAPLRGICALGLVRCGHPQLMEVLVDLLNDDEPQVRIMACRAPGYAAHDAGALLLRMKILAGDRDDDVLNEAFQQLVRLQPRDALPFVERFLDHPDAVRRQSAFLALGASREPEALRTLVQRWSRSIDADSRRVLALAIAVHRSAEGFEFLL
jgi:HEAT repeat protein